jgi:hypothetical protein
VAVNTGSNNAGLPISAFTGGVVGGLLPCLGALLVAAVVLMRRRRRRRARASAASATPVSVDREQRKTPEKQKSVRDNGAVKAAVDGTVGNVNPLRAAKTDSAPLQAAPFTAKQASFKKAPRAAPQSVRAPSVGDGGEQSSRAAARSGTRGKPSEAAAQDEHVPETVVAIVDALPSGWSSAWTDEGGEQTYMHSRSRLFRFPKNVLVCTFQRSPPPALCAVEYFRHQDTGQTSWRRPTSGAGADAVAAASEGLAEGWSAAWDVNAEAVFYENGSTGQASWERPIITRDEF